MLLILFSNVDEGQQQYPITPADLKDDLRLSDAELARLEPTLNVQIAALTEVLEHRLNRKLMSKTVMRKFDCFSEKLNLLIGGIQSIESITYLDADGVRQTLPSSEYTLDNYVEPCVVMEAVGKSWPASANSEHNIEVTCVAGYGDHTAVPEQAKLWLRSAVQKVMVDCEGGELSPNFMNALVQSLKVYA